MAPANDRKRKSDVMEELAVRAVTPTRSPARKKLKITQQQKQALMDNLQLESMQLRSAQSRAIADITPVTERARQLRAEYALQCADLRARIERRVNRIPISIRKTTMGDLMQQHETTEAVQPKTSPPKQHISVEIAAPKPLPPLPQQATSKLPSSARLQPQPAPPRGKKRMSPEIHIASDEQNEHEPHSLPVVKSNKRAKPAPTTKGTRTTSRSVASKEQTSVLSPRSHNSRTLPRSPIKDVCLPTSPAKSMIARPIGAMSPVRLNSPLKTAATAATSAISASVHGIIEHAKRGGATTAGKLSRTASKEKKEAFVYAKGQMLPPPRPKVNVAASSSPQRAFSQASAHSNSTEISIASSGTTVLKSKRGGRAAATSKASAPVTMEAKSPVEKKKGGLARAASAAKTALKRNANTAGTAAVEKKVVVAEPAAGRRVLRKRA